MAYATALASGAFGLLGLISSPSALAQILSMTLVATTPARMAPPVPMIFHATAPMAMSVLQRVVCRRAHERPTRSCSL